MTMGLGVSAPGADDESCRHEQELPVSREWRAYPGISSPRSAATGPKGRHRGRSSSAPEAENSCRQESASASAARRVKSGTWYHHPLTVSRFGAILGADARAGENRPDQP